MATTYSPVSPDRRFWAVVARRFDGSWEIVASLDLALLPYGAIKATSAHETVRQVLDMQAHAKEQQLRAVVSDVYDWHSIRQIEAPSLVAIQRYLANVASE
jgi:hypothetical protein